MTKIRTAIYAAYKIPIKIPLLLNSLVNLIGSHFQEVQYCLQNAINLLINYVWLYVTRKVVNLCGGKRAFLLHFSQSANGSLPMWEIEFLEARDCNRTFTILTSVFCWRTSGSWDLQTQVASEKVSQSEKLIRG